VSALDRPLADAARLAVGAGCAGIEVTGRAPHLVPDANVDAARAAGEGVRAAGAAVVAYGSYLGRHGRLSLEQAERDVAIAAALGAPLLRAWAEEPGPEGGAPFEAVVRLLQHAGDAAREHGIDVVIERHVRSWADTPDRVERLLAAIERPNVALNYQVLDFLPPREIEAQPQDAARLVPRARYFHLKNYQRQAGQPDGPLLPGGSLAGGALDYRAILRAALRAGYAGPLTIEFLSWEQRSTEDKLRDDVAFVREVLAGAAAR
jgi:sugar phosphate isomerase/epimerase